MSPTLNGSSALYSVLNVARRLKYDRIILISTRDCQYDCQNKYFNFYVIPIDLYYYITLFPLTLTTYQDVNSHAVIVSQLLIDAVNDMEIELED